MSNEEVVCRFEAQRNIGSDNVKTFSYMATFSVVIYDALHSFDWSGYKSKPFQDQSQDSEITAAFSFDKSINKVVFFPRLFGCYYI